MDQALSRPEELNARREALRERLRAVAEDIIEAVEDIARPKTYLDAARSARAAIIIDRMIAQLFSDTKPSSYSMCYDYAPRYDDGERGDSFASRMPVERVEQGSDGCAENAPIVTSSPFGLDGLARHERFTGSFVGSPPPSFASAGEDELKEPAGEHDTEAAIDDTFDAEKEARANAIFAAYCEAKRLERFQKSAQRFSGQEARQNKEREAEEQKARERGLGP
jgi:hypothetical protein